MSWFKASLSQYAQEALSQAQASIDRALEIEPAQDPLSGYIKLEIKFAKINCFERLCFWCNTLTN